MTKSQATVGTRVTLRSLVQHASGKIVATVDDASVRVAWDCEPKRPVRVLLKNISMENGS